ncbi:MAG: two-component sensor histidine kinase [Chitinophagaceae bacterium]|nr:two-component sensor histidine kinase [Chitinophagaceae bacterium]
MIFSGFRSRVRKKRITRIYALYWFLLAYIVAALIFWFISLNKQNEEIITFKKEQLIQSAPDYNLQIEKLDKEDRRKRFQYIGEGTTFFVLIMVGAVIVFRLLRTQFRLARQQRDFMVAVTHELKTPIAVTKLNLETLQKRKLDESVRDRLIAATLAETDRLNALCSNMLLLNEPEKEKSVMTRENIQVSELLEECLNQQKLHFPQRVFRSEIQEGLVIYADRILIQLAINNLLNNAVKYSPKEAPVVARSFGEKGKVVIQVIDEGEGIRQEEAGKIFDKYFRGEGMQAKGTGLGLYVTQRIVHQNDGALTVKPNHPKGSVFTISFAVI